MGITTVRNGVYGITFDADEDNIRFALEFFCGKCRHFQTMFTFQIGVQLQTVPAYGGKVFATCNASDVFAG